MENETKNEVMISFQDHLASKLEAVCDALPKNFNRERFIQNARALLNEKPEFKEMNRSLIVQGLLKGAYLGLDFMNHECYLIPYGNDVKFQTSYQGEKKFVKRYSVRPVKDIYAKIIRNGDSFQERITDGRPTIDFTPIPLNKGEILGAFAVVLYSDGGMDYEAMSTDEINAVRNNYSKAATSKAWKNSWDEMAKKTVIRRLCKHIETDFETVEAHRAWEEGSDFTVKQEKGDPDEVVDVFKDKVVTADNGAEVITNG
jgi:recombination protein RecT